MESAERAVCLGVSGEPGGTPARWMLTASRGAEALLEACVHGSVDVMEGVLRAGADPNGSWPAGLRPLHLLAHRGDLSGARLLLRYGADANASTERQETPAYFAAAGDHAAVLRLLADHGGELARPAAGGITPLHVAMAKHAFAAAAILLWLGVPPTVTTATGLLPLQCADPKRLPRSLRRLFAQRRDGAARDSRAAAARSRVLPLTTQAAPGVLS